MKIYPYKFEPIYKEKIWGGRNLARMFGRQMPPGNIGESWELADLPESASVIANGPEAGKTITELSVALGGKLIGRARPMSDGRFPLLLKLLDAEDILSLQVHPDQQSVREIGPSAALKTECWYVLESRGGFIYKGSKPGVTAQQFRDALEHDQAADVVRRIDVKTGDFHYLPAGTVHALGRGVVVAEVQTPSDTTYRVTDWGRGRQTHIELSMKCIRLELTGDDCAANSPASDVLLETEHFIVARRTVAAGGQLALPVGRCTAIMMLQGQALIGHDGKIECQVPALAGDTVLLPAELHAPMLSAKAGCCYLEITLPENK
jgi:mannose-6-phosphate isomerase